MHKHKIEKPETTEEKVDSLWCTVHNHVLTRLDILGLKVNALIALMVLAIALMGIIIALVAMVI